MVLDAMTISMPNVLPTAMGMLRPSFSPVGESVGAGLGVSLELASTTDELGAFIGAELGEGRTPSPLGAGSGTVEVELGEGEIEVELGATGFELKLLGVGGELLEAETVPKVVRLSNLTEIRLATSSDGSHTRKAIVLTLRHPKNAIRGGETIGTEAFLKLSGHIVL